MSKCLALWVGGEPTPVHFCSVLSSNWLAGGPHQVGFHGATGAQSSIPSKKAKPVPEERPRQLAGGALAGKAKDGPLQPGPLCGWEAGGLRSSLPALAQCGCTPPLRVSASHESRDTRIQHPTMHKALAKPSDMAVALRDPVAGCTCSKSESHPSWSWLNTEKFLLQQ